VAANNILINMEDIRNAGLSAFEQSYEWLISDAEYCSFVNSVMLRFEEILSVCSRDVLDVVISDYRFLFFLVHHIHYCVAINRFGLEKSHLHIGPGLAQFLHPNWNQLSVHFEKDNVDKGIFGNARANLAHKTYRNLRRTRDTVFYNKGKNPIGHLLGIETSWAAIGPLIDFQKAYLSVTSDFIRLDEWDHYKIDRIYESSEFKWDVETNFLKPFISFVGNRSRKLGTDINIDEVFSTWSSRMTTLHSYYSGYRKFKMRPDNLVITGAGNSFRKIVGTAFQREGTKVFVMHHGETSGVEKHPHGHRNDGSFSKYFVCPTARITEAFRKNYSSSLIEKTIDRKYMVVNTNHYESLYERYRGQKERVSQRVVMLIGYGMNYSRYLDGGGYFFYFQLDLQYRLAKAIKKLGYKLIYKSHPDRVREVENLFNEVSDQVEARPFEQVWNSADIYLFTIPGTTVFGGALLTKKPMILIDIESNNWNYDSYDLLKKRCMMVSGKFNEKNRIVFDESELESHLKNDSEVNDEFIREYYLADSQT